MELGISAGAGTEADLRTARVDASRRAVTDHILALADQAGYGAALIDAAAPGSSEASVITWPQFARMIRAAADGLSRRGLREDDTAGVFVADAVSHAVAVHADPGGRGQCHAGAPGADRGGHRRPAQAVPGPAADHLGRAGRASPPRPPSARWVRQVFAFGEAEGTTPFGSLLHTARHGQVYPNGSTGPGHNGHAGPGRREGPVDGAAAPDVDVMAHVLDLAGLGPDGPALRLTSRDVVVAAPPCGDPDVYTSLLDLALAAGAAIVAAPLAQVPAAVGAYKGTVAVVPRGTDVPGFPAGRVFAIG